MAFAVVACAACRTPWAVDLRHRAVACPRCSCRTALATRRRLWEGPDAAAARQAAASLAAAFAPGVPEGTAQAVLARATAPRLPRHDSAADAAAAQARAHRGLGRRADEVALWLLRLAPEADHDALLAAMEKAGLDAPRAQKEVVRLLATDVIYEPRPGRYRLVRP